MDYGATEKALIAALWSCRGDEGHRAGGQSKFAAWTRINIAIVHVPIMDYQERQPAGNHLVVVQVGPEQAARPPALQARAERGACAGGQRGAGIPRCSGPFVLGWWSIFSCMGEAEARHPEVFRAIVLDGGLYLPAWEGQRPGIPRWFRATCAGWESTFAFMGGTRQASRGV